MVLPLPKLDDRAFADLAAEGRSMIPALDPGWTNHNPSDPGITLLELFAWLTDVLLYRIDRITDQHRLTYLRLLNGPGWAPQGPLEVELRSAIARLRSRQRAVTAADHELLAREAAADFLGLERADQRAACVRARCVPRRDLTAADEAARDAAREGHLSIIVVPRIAEAAAGGPASPLAAPRPSAALLAAVADGLEAKRLLGVRVHVVGPVYVPVGLELAVVRRPDATADLASRVARAVAAFLDPAPEDRAGWAFGQEVLVSDLYARVEGVEGVDYAVDVEPSSALPAGLQPDLAAAEPLPPNDHGEPVGLGLRTYHLPVADPGALRVAVGDSALRVRVRVTLAPPTAEPAVRRLVRDAIRAQIGPFGGGPDGTLGAAVSADALRQAVDDALRAASAGTALGRLTLRDEADAEVAGLDFEPGQLAEWELAFAGVEGEEG